MPAGPKTERVNNALDRTDTGIGPTHILPSFTTAPKTTVPDQSIHGYVMSPQGHTNKRMALDGKPGARTLILSSIVWVDESRTIDSPGGKVNMQSNKAKCISMYLYNIT